MEPRDDSGWNHYSIGSFSVEPLMEGFVRNCSHMVQAEEPFIVVVRVYLCAVCVYPEHVCVCVCVCVCVVCGHCPARYHEPSERC